MPRAKPFSSGGVNYALNPDLAGLDSLGLLEAVVHCLDTRASTLSSTFTGVDWSRVLAPGASARFGFCATR